MIFALSSLALVVGASGVLMGLVMIGTQVQVHQIRVNSRGSHVFRMSAVLLLLGTIFAGASVLPVEDNRIVLFLICVSPIIGFSGLPATWLVWHHEKQQDDFVWRESLARQMFILYILICFVSMPVFA